MDLSPGCQDAQWARADLSSTTQTNGHLRPLRQTFNSVGALHCTATSIFPSFPGASQVPTDLHPSKPNQASTPVGRSDLGAPRTALSFCTIFRLSGNEGHWPSRVQCSLLHPAYPYTVVTLVSGHGSPKTERPANPLALLCPSIPATDHPKHHT